MSTSASAYLPRRFSDGGRDLLEVVLSALLSSFRFSLLEGENGDIVWNRAGVSYPSSHKSGTKPSMPVKMEII